MVPETMVCGSLKLPFNLLTTFNWFLEKSSLWLDDVIFRN